MKKEIQKLLETEAKAILNIPVNDSFEKAIHLLHECTHVKGGKIIVSGMGKAGQIAENIATTFSSTGSPAVFLHPADAQHGDLGVIRANLSLILISNSGKTLSLIHISEPTRRTPIS